MELAHTILAASFWISVVGVAYAYAGYPLLLDLLARAFTPPTVPPPLSNEAPARVTLLIAAHNEKEVIEGRIRNALELDYPRDRLEIVVASDGSTDGTIALARRFEPVVRVMDFAHRRGKAATLNAALERIEADLVVFSDANTAMAPDSVRRLVSWFVDPEVVCVCGRLILRDGSCNADGAYWRYETFLKLREARLGGLLGANGAIYALRRDQYVPLPVGTMVDDFVLPLLVKLNAGGRIVYDAEAVAIEESAPDLGSEFRRRTRIGAGGWQALGMLWPMLAPTQGWTAFTFWSHKVLRWACPFLMLAALASSLALSSSQFYRAMLVTQTAFYAVAALCAAIATRVRLPRPLRVLPLFAGMNLALLVGVLRGMCGGQTGIWQATRRAEPESA
jgi:cellulose synthase/poly-beta-1,6-N-acetylglucosamine synthase-like glycosyltransferase